MTCNWALHHNYYFLGAMKHFYGSVHTCFRIRLTFYHNITSQYNFLKYTVVLHFKTTHSARRM